MKKMKKMIWITPTRKQTKEIFHKIKNYEEEIKSLKEN